MTHIRNSSYRKGERGITMLLIVIGMVVFLGIAALAVDVVSLYVARSEAQRAADAAALAAVRALASSGTTSDPGDASGLLAVGQSLAVQAATAVATQQKVAGRAITSSEVTVTPDFSNGSNPKVSVSVQLTNLPIFFARIWGSQVLSVGATAKAEAFNPSPPPAGSPGPPIEVASVKPLLVPNCNPVATSGPTNPKCSRPYLVLLPGNSSTVKPESILGQTITLRERDPAQPQTVGPVAGIGPVTPYYPLSTGIPQATACPSSSAVSCPGIGAGGYKDNIACSSNAPLACGATVSVSASTGTLQSTTYQATRCLIHADPNTTGLNQGQDDINAGLPVTLDGGGNNPNANLRAVSNISRSDSVITLPIFDGADPCPGGGGKGGGLNFASTLFFFDEEGGCGGAASTVTVVGFLQVGVRQILPAGPGLPNGGMEVVVLNVAGCGPGRSGTPVAGGNLSPVPVRLIQ